VTKLTAMQVAEIRSSGESHAVTARRYGVSKSQVSNIRRGVSWA
jgi:DNA-binding transcriptional regulator YiaG